MSSDFNSFLILFCCKEKKMINDALKEQRTIHGLTQVELAQKTGIPQSTLSAWEKGINIPNVMDCIKLADFYKITLDDLVGREMEKEW